MIFNNFKRPAGSYSSAFRNATYTIHFGFDAASKSHSSKFINESGFTNNKFSWQDGFGAFSYSKSDVDAVIHYIKNQEKHHKNKSFTEEYLEFLNKLDVPYDERYIFKPIDYDPE